MGKQMPPRDTPTLRDEARPSRNDDLESLRSKKRRRAHIVAMYASKHIRFDGTLSQHPYIDNESSLRLEISNTESVILLSLEGL